MKAYLDSPIAHVQNVRTPTLVMCAVADSSFYRALREHKSSHSSSIFSVGGDSPCDPVHREHIRCEKCSARLTQASAVIPYRKWRLRCGMRMGIYCLPLATPKAS